MAEDIKKFEPLWGSWYITDVVGEGAYGKVYKAQRKDFETVYTSAVKHIHIPQSKSELKSVISEAGSKKSAEKQLENAVKAIVGEFELMSKLKGNSNIVSYEDHLVIKNNNEISWDIFIRMELLKSLTDYIGEKGITKKEVIKLGIDICKALELCKKHNIIHRDIKPENIFISENGDFKLGDFGVARQIEKTSSGLSQKGTYGYIAPEVYKGEAYGYTVDIYSLGLVMYRYLNKNRLPFMPPYPYEITNGDIEVSLNMRIRGDEIPEPVNAEGKLSQIILKACSYDPSDRYSEPADMRKALEKILPYEDDCEVVPPLKEDYDDTPTKPMPSDKTPKENPEKKKRNFKLSLICTATVLTIIISVVVYAIVPKIMSKEKINYQNYITSGGYYSVLLMNDGKVYCGGIVDPFLQMATVEWSDITATSAVENHCVGLKKDGTVVFAGENYYGEGDTDYWTDIKAISTGAYHTVGLKKDGTVIATKIYNSELLYDTGQSNVEEWKNIKAISAAQTYTVGLRNNGTVVSTKILSVYLDNGQTDVEGWTDIIAISASQNYTAGLKADGTVITTNDKLTADTEDWTNIVAIEATERGLIGIKKDGSLIYVNITEVPTAWDIAVKEWSNIVAVSAKGEIMLGLSKDGTVYYAYAPETKTYPMWENIWSENKQ